MAVITETNKNMTNSVQLCNSPQPNKLKKKRSRNNKKQNNNQNKDKNSIIVCTAELSDSRSSISSSSSTSSLSSDDRSPTRSRRRRSRGKKSSGTKNVVNQSVEIPEEEQAKYLAMDCEMVGVGRDGFRSVLARVTLVNWQGEVVLDLYVRPVEPVTDYRTFVSGITEEHLEQGVDLATCRDQVLQALFDKVLIGHGLKNDMSALGINHPWWMTRDTAKWEPFQKVRFEDGILWPRKLKDLCQEKLKREIQILGRPHSPIEDALAALDLYKSVRNKWEKAMQYKINKTEEIMNQKVGQ